LNGYGFSSLIFFSRYFIIFHQIARAIPVQSFMIQLGCANKKTKRIYLL